MLFTICNRLLFSVLWLVRVVCLTGCADIFMYCDGEVKCETPGNECNRLTGKSWQNYLTCGLGTIPQ